jgi:hypothetical protein
MTKLEDFCEPGDTYRDFTTGGAAETIPDPTAVLLRAGARRHDEDGQVYLAYFRNDAVLGFIWDGNIEHPVQVTRETSEPVIDTFQLPDLGVGLSPMTLFVLFKRECDRYTDTFEETR